MVMVREPVVAFRLTVMVMIEVPAPVIDVGLKLTVTFVPVTEPDSAIEELKPPLTVVVIVTLPLLFLETAMEVGEAAMVKFGVAPVMVSETVVVATVLPEVPFTVM